MTRQQLEHLIRAAAAVTDQNEIVVVGSQSILGAIPDAPPPLTLSMEADLYPLHRPDLADLIDGSLGEDSEFHQSFGYYAQGVGPETAILPQGWAERLVTVQNANTRMAIAYCLDPGDLAASKLAAGREKDLLFVRALLQSSLVAPEVLHLRINELPLVADRKRPLLKWLAVERRSLGDAAPGSHRTS
jgi:hypothetical protein